MKKRAEELAEAHWGYLEDLLLSHDVDVDEVNIIGFHYQTAFVHGFRHGEQMDDREGHYESSSS